jgi:hypothetical protein
MLTPKNGTGERLTCRPSLVINTSTLEKISSKESVKNACGRQCAIVRQKGCLQESFRECVVTWPDARKERVGGVYEMDIGVGALI